RRGGRAAVRLDGQAVLLLAADRVLRPQVLRGLDHAAGHGVVRAAGGEAAADQSVLELDVAAADAPADVLVEEGCARHRLRTAGDDDLGAAGGDRAHAVDDGLQAGAAAAIDLATGHRDGHAGVQRDDAADRGCLHVRVALAEDDVVDDVGIEAGALQQGGDDLAAELLRRDVLELAAEGAHGGAQRLADDDVVR